MKPVFTIKNPMPPGMFFRRFTYAVRREQHDVEVEHKRQEDERAVNWLNATIQRELLNLLLTGRVSYEDACNPSTVMGQAFKVWIGEQSDADREARKAPPVTVTYMEPSHGSRI